MCGQMVQQFKNYISQDEIGNHLGIIWFIILLKDSKNLDNYLEAGHKAKNKYQTAVIFRLSGVH